MNRWSANHWYEFGQWVRNDVPKYRDKPGLSAVAERADLAADLLDAVMDVHFWCSLDACPTRQAIDRVMRGDA